MHIKGFQLPLGKGRKRPVRNQKRRGIHELLIKKNIHTNLVDDGVCYVLIQSSVLQHRKDPASTSPSVRPSNHVGSKIYGENKKKGFMDNRSIRTNQVQETTISCSPRLASGSSPRLYVAHLVASVCRQAKDYREAGLCTT